MPFKEGDPKPEGSGRKPGTQNKMTSIVKDAIEQAFQELDPVAYLKKVAIMDMKAFCGLLGKTIPKDIQVAGEGGGPIKFIIVTGVPADFPTEEKPDADKGS